jgi:hypothetical protein
MQAKLKTMKDNEYYIGWMAKAPGGYARFIRKYLLMLSFFIIALSAVIAFSQKKFGKGNFEFGTLTQIKGTYFNNPVPNLLVVNGKDIWGHENIITIPLIGFGKHGADAAIGDYEKANKMSLDGKEVTVKGTLLYNDGKLLMQVDINEDPFTNVSTSSSKSLAVFKDLGAQTVRGEIIDPKCYFGVMKPGEGKPHKDCAIRCILGGMPPVLAVRNDKNEANYYLIVGSNGEKMNNAVKDFIATPVEFHANLVQYNDWIILYVNPSNGIKQYSYLQEHFGNQIAQCKTACFK